MIETIKTLEEIKPEVINEALPDNAPKTEFFQEEVEEEEAPFTV